MVTGSSPASRRAVKSLPAIRNPLFHLPQDRWPHAVDASAVARVAAAASRLVLGLTR
jgi:hypothetical protein